LRAAIPFFVMHRYHWMANAGFSPIWRRTTFPSSITGKEAKTSFLGTTSTLAPVRMRASVARSTPPPEMSTAAPSNRQPSM
jgi:hypothetical protein